MKLTVNVTQQHIQKGTRNDCRRCPVALALNEQHPCENGWRVSWLYARRDPSVLGAKLPENAQRFVTKFDDGKRNVEPFTFDLYDYEAE